MAGNKASGRKNTIIHHPNKDNIIRQIIERELGVSTAPSFAKIADSIGVQEDTILIGSWQNEHLETG